MSEAINLSLHHVSKTFRTDVLKKPFRALTEVSCKFPSGQCTGLLGHNGAGKTTTIRTILGLISADKGSVLINDKEISIKDRAAIGFVPEVNKMAINLTCRETLDLHVRLFLSLSSSARLHLVDELLEKVGLKNFAKKKIKHLSKGMARRLAWAQAVIHKPRLLILDEPFSGLDPIGRRDMNEWIAEQKNLGVTIVLCTHDLWTVETLCDEINILNKGRLVFSSLDDQSAKNTKDIESYEVEISGTSESQVRDLIHKFQFDQSCKITTTGFRTRLTFAKYQEAGLFVQASISSGFLINKFGHTPMWDSDRILQFFDQRGEP